MMKSSEKSRLYAGSDDEFLQSVRVMHGQFTLDKADFTAFDTMFSDPFGDNWLAQIETAADKLNDDYIVAIQATYTKRVEDKLTECRDFYQKMKYFIERAFPDNKEIWVQFGYPKYDEARKTETKMISFMGILHKAAVEYSEELIAVGFTQAQIDQIKSLHDELTDEIGRAHV